jgi:hypothetical protein
MLPGEVYDVLIGACVAALQYTGPVSSPEYLSHLPRAINYRGVPPA